MTEVALAFPEPAEIGRVSEEQPVPKPNGACCPRRTGLPGNGGCKPGDSCVVAASGPQVERFFRTYPALAEDLAGDDVWERHAVAARYLSQNMPQSVPGDPDEAVRRVLTRRLPFDPLDPLISDPARGVARRRLTCTDEGRPDLGAHHGD